MKEFSAQTGGRYTYVDDIMNLQELSLSLNQIFDQCDNFIISGCNVEGDTITPGYVYINNKVRHFTGANGIKQWPQYIYESNKSETVTYQSGGSKVGRNIYGCTCAAIVPSIQDPLTGNSPAYLQIPQTGGVRMKDAFIGKYALLLNPESGEQRVNKKTVFENLYVTGDTILVNAKIQKSGAELYAGYEGADFKIAYRSASNQVSCITLTGAGGLQFTVGGVKQLEIENGTVVFNTPVVSQEGGTFGNITIKEGDIYNNASTADDGAVNVNMLSYNGENKYFRNTYIGNGKGEAVVSVLGPDSMVKISGKQVISGNNADLLTLHSQQINEEMNDGIIWSNKDLQAVARLSFATGCNMELINTVGGLVIKGKQYVDLGPEIKENGQLLSLKYVTQELLTEKLITKADGSSVYKIEDADKKFANKADGFTQFVNQKYPADALRKQIAAAGEQDLRQYPKLSNCLSDMATSEELRKRVRDNIGAAGAGEFQLKIMDTQWIKITQAGHLAVDGDIYARQFGPIVSIQGQLKTKATGAIVFELPEKFFKPPKYDVVFSCALTNHRAWNATIAGGKYHCVVTYEDGGLDRMISFSMTYMTI